PRLIRHAPRLSSFVCMSRPSSGLPSSVDNMRITVEDRIDRNERDLMCVPPFLRAFTFRVSLFRDMLVLRILQSVCRSSPASRILISRLFVCIPNAVSIYFGYCLSVHERCDSVTRFMKSRNAYSEQ